MKTATLIGAPASSAATFWNILLKDDSFSTVRVLVRRPLDISHPKLPVVVLDFADLAAFKTGIAGSDAVFCAVGTTNAKVKGDKVAYRKVDYDIPVNAARFCAETGVRRVPAGVAGGRRQQGANFYHQAQRRGGRGGECPEHPVHRHLPAIHAAGPPQGVATYGIDRPGHFPTRSGSSFHRNTSPLSIRCGPRDDRGS